MNVYTLDCGHDFACTHLHPLYRPAFCETCQHTTKLVGMTREQASDASGIHGATYAAGSDELAKQDEDIDWQPLSPRGAHLVTEAEDYLRAWLQIDVA
ncbi:MAG TPA: hypothetical protein VGI58_00255 [Streptosporangiaceae bacterium]